jgi:hypothetical protein
MVGSVQLVLTSYSKDWADFFVVNPSMSDAFGFARMLAGTFGFDVHF